MTNLKPDQDRTTRPGFFPPGLGCKNGKEYWRSLNELADSDAFDELVKQEFPRQASLTG